MGGRVVELTASRWAVGSFKLELQQVLGQRNFSLAPRELNHSSTRFTTSHPLIRYTVCSTCRRKRRWTSWWRASRQVVPDTITIGGSVGWLELLRREDKMIEFHRPCLSTVSCPTTLSLILYKMFAARQIIGATQRRAFSVSARDVSLESACQCLVQRQYTLCSMILINVSRRPPRSPSSVPVVVLASLCRFS
jgi:hypothetical protein